MEIESSSSLLKRQKILESNLLPPRSFIPNASDKNFEIAILLKIVHRSYKETPVSIIPQGPGADVVSYSLGANMVLIEGMLV